MKTQATEAQGLAQLTTGAKRASLMTPQQASEHLQVPVPTLAVWRSTNRVRLPYIKVGGHVRYRFADLEQFLTDNTHASATTQEPK